VAAGKLSCRKGKTFERSIAAALREIFDPPELVEAIKAAGNTDRKRLMSESVVRRGDQAKNAREPDIVVRGSAWWFELQDAAHPTPLAKLQQAERDMGRAIARGSETWSRPVAICHKMQSRSITVTMRFATLAAACGMVMFYAARRLPSFAVTIDYDDLLALLRGKV